MAAWTQVVSAAHLTHYPGRGWSPAGDPAAVPEWPEPTPIAALIRDAGLDPEPLREALSGTGADAAALARTLGDRPFRRGAGARRGGNQGAAAARARTADTS